MTEEKFLFIVRHGKSTWDYGGVSDIDRPLKDRGIRDSYEMADLVLKKKVLPDTIISSPAVRALHTAIIFSRVLDFPADEIIINQDLYLAEYNEILSVIKATDDSRKSLMIFGHNPGFSDLANYLSNLGIDNIPTAGLVLLKFNTDNWNGVSRKSLASEFFETPRNL